MTSIGSNEIRVLVQPCSAPGSPAHSVPAAVFKKLFDAVYAALMSADREVHPKSASSAFLISYLTVTPCEFGLLEMVMTGGPGAVSLFRRCAARVYRSDYQILLQHRRLMRPFQRIAAALEQNFVVLVRYHDTELPLDEFFRRQVGRVGLANEAPPLTDTWFAGQVVTSFDGRLETIDYRGSVWTGRLTLAGGETQIECVFDKSIGEDGLNPFGNKGVAITGRAIFTGDSPLPERVEVMTIEERRRATAATTIRGALAPAEIGDLEDGLDCLH